MASVSLTESSSVTETLKESSNVTENAKQGLVYGNILGKFKKDEHLVKLIRKIINEELNKRM